MCRTDLWRILFCGLAVLLFFGTTDCAAKGAPHPLVTPPAPPTNVTVEDRLNDSGNALIVKWMLSSDDINLSVEEVDDGKKRGVARYEVWRKGTKKDKKGNDPVFEKVGSVTYQENEFVSEKCESGDEYLYRVYAVSSDGVKSEVAKTAEPFSPVVQLFNRKRIWFGIFLAMVCGVSLYFIEMARGGKDLKIRKIAGLEAINEAIGRATEMGSSCLFVPGILDINDIQTVAGMTVLSHVAQTSAEYGARIEVPTSRSLVMTVARETVESAYLAAGRPDAYREDDIHYITDEQFGYVASVTGTMVREKPAACFYMGAFYAESLLLAETGNAIGAIQIAGTAMPSQLPFFVAACDYTLIGEEFFAASAYLSGEAHQLGSLKGQDIGKIFAAALIVVTSIFMTFFAFDHRPVADDATPVVAKPLLDTEWDERSWSDKTVFFVTNHLLNEGGFLP